MQAIIMAGGEGTRLKSVTGDTPKPMARLAGRPVLEHILLLLRRCGITEACITLRYRPEIIENYFGDGHQFGMRLRYHLESVPLGTAGGVKACADFYGDQDFLVISGDCACDFDLRTLADIHRRQRAAVTIALASQEAPLQYGTVLTDGHGRVISFIEKPDWRRVVSDLVNTGIYLISPAVMAYVPENRTFDFAKDLFPGLLEMGYPLIGVPMSGYWCDIGTPRAYYQCNLDALDGKLRLAAMPPTVPEPQRSPEPPGDVRMEYPCVNRARLMRAVSQYLMEAGADFSHGCTLNQEHGRVNISPSPDRDALIISAVADQDAEAQALAKRYKSLLKKLDVNR